MNNKYLLIVSHCKLLVNPMKADSKKKHQSKHENIAVVEKKTFAAAWEVKEEGK